MVPAGLGTQTAGSVIRPASFCGTYGFKPTLGLVSRSGVLMQSHTLDTIGVLARSLDDLALITDVMAAFDPTDSVSVQGSRPRLASSLAQLQAGGVHVGVVKTPAWDLVDEATRKAFDGLVAKLGAAAETLDVPGLDEVIEDQRIVQLAENVPYYGPLLDQHEALLSPLMKQRLRTGIAIPVRQYLECLLRREPAAARLSAAFAPGRVLMTLSAPGPAPRGLETTGNPIFNGLWTFLGVPALTLPLLTVDGAPVGVQLIGDRGQDAMLLAAARWLEIYLSKT
jgi:Asp-tRNA(Asn)/Glu-tRNA(Gln) amidotransferase A subunit family amidase